MNTNLNVRANTVKLLIKDSFERSAALREQAFVKKIGTVKPNIRIHNAQMANSDHLLAKILAAA